MSNIVNMMQQDSLILSSDSSSKGCNGVSQFLNSFESSLSFMNNDLAVILAPLVIIYVSTYIVNIIGAVH